MRMSPFDQIRNARNQFGFALFLSEAVEANRVTGNSFVKELSIITGGDGLKLGQGYDKKGLSDLAFNGILVGMAVCSIATDTALDDKYGGSKKKGKTTAEIGAARAIIYMLRCAFAHDPLMPQWEARDPYYQAAWTVPSIKVELDLTRLNGAPLVPDHFGGYEGFFRLVDFCMSLVK